MEVESRLLVLFFSSCTENNVWAMLLGFIVKVLYLTGLCVRVAPILALDPEVVSS